MLNGDISNQRSFVIGVRCEGTLFKMKDNSLKDKVLNRLRGSSILRAEVNDKVLSLINYIYWNTDMTVHLIVDSKNYSKEVENYLTSFPCNQIGQIFTNISEVTMMLNTGELTYYISNDTIDLANVNSRYAVDVDTFNTKLRRHIKRFE